MILEVSASSSDFDLLDRSCAIPKELAMSDYFASSLRALRRFSRACASYLSRSVGTL
jgi:hypothetical protein